MGHPNAHIGDVQYRKIIARVNAALGITDAHLEAQSLPLVRECNDLIDAGEDIFNRPQRMASAALPHWQALLAQADRDGITLQLVSAFRSVKYQASLIAEKCEAGRSLEDVLKVNAAPGYSEHHAGTALDLSTPDTQPLSEAFDSTPAFDWLQQHAAAHGFSMSYGRDNPHALVYEPWHWNWSPATRSTE